MFSLVLNLTFSFGSILWQIDTLQKELQMPNSASEISESNQSDSVWGVDLKKHIEEIELGLIKQALDKSNGVVAYAARLLNVKRTTLVEKMRKYNLKKLI